MFFFFFTVKTTDTLPLLLFSKTIKRKEDYQVHKHMQHIILHLHIVCQIWMGVDGDEWG